MNANPPAGWYPDPHGEAELRYWDGSTWTEHTSGQAPAAAGPTQLDQPQAAPTAGAQAQGPAGFQQPPGAPGPAGGGPNKPLLFGLGALVLIGAVVGALFLTGVLGGDDGGGNQDEEDIRALVEETLEDPSDDSVCDNFTDDILEQLEESPADCETTVSTNEDIEFEIQDVNVRGDEGTVELEIDGDDESIDVEKDGDDWKFAENLSGVCCIAGVGGTDGDTIPTDDATGAEAEVRDVVNRWLAAVRTRDAQEFCNTTSVRFAEDRGVEGTTTEVIEKCVDEAPRMIRELIIADEPSIDSVELEGGTGFQEATVTLTDSSVLTVTGTPGEFWFVDTFR